MTLKGVWTCLRKPANLFMAMGLHGFLNWIPDEQYVKIAYRLAMGKKLNLRNPRTFNEKLQWLKLYDRKPEYTMMVDKYKVRDYIAETIGEEYLIPLLGVWDDPDKIDFDALPDQFVLKCNHNSGRGMCICRDKSKLDIPLVKQKLRQGLAQNYYLNGREWPYKNVERRIIAEKYMQDADNEVLPVYKVFNFSGDPKIIQAIQNDKTERETIDYYDSNWNLLLMKQNFPNSKCEVSAPLNLEKMLELGRRVSKSFPFLRTDWYLIDNKVYFSEFTFYSDAGLTKFDPEEWDKKLGEWIDLTSLEDGKDDYRK